MKWDREVRMYTGFVRVLWCSDVQQNHLVDDGVVWNLLSMLQAVLEILCALRVRIGP